MERRESFTHGSSSPTDFWQWVNERHAIYNKRAAGEDRPWTDDVVLRDYKFTNVFRELDRGTIALRTMEAGQTDPGLILFNTVWYRLYNWHEHATDLGFCDYDALEKYMTICQRTGKRIFTGAHMVRGVGGEAKVWPYLRLSKHIWENRDGLARACTSIYEAFRVMMLQYLIGDFTAYEIASDLRWSLGIDSDKYTWGNPGNGARRGLKRLGCLPTVDSMRWIWDSAPLFAAPHVMEHYPVETSVVHDSVEHTGEPQEHAWPPFELREVEHSLCEFDKWERARRGQGTPRQKFNGQASQV